MELSQTWKSLFESWPRDLPHRGVVTTSLDEQIPFKGYMLKSETILLERSNPDPLGVRYIVLPYANVMKVKLIDVIKESTFSSMGFEGKLSGK